MATNKKDVKKRQRHASINNSIDLCVDRTIRLTDLNVAEFDEDFFILLPQQINLFKWTKTSPLFKYNVGSLFPPPLAMLPKQLSSGDDQESMSISNGSAPLCNLFDVAGDYFIILLITTRWRQ